MYNQTKAKLDVSVENKNYMNIHWAKPAAGVLLPLSAIRTNYSLGCGSILDLKAMVDLAVATNQEIIQILPLNESIDAANNNCPYFTVSAFANDPVYIDLNFLEDVFASDIATNYLNVLKQDPLLQSEKVLFTKLKQLREPVLIAAYESFCLTELVSLTSRALKFKQYVKQYDSSWLHEYALFRVLQKYFKFDWLQWPENFKNRNKKELKAFSEEHLAEVNYFKYLQWVFYEQSMEAILYAHEKGVSIMGDVPIFVAPQSADVWSHQEFFEMSFYSGAPADPFSEEGQLWGHPHFNLSKMEETNFSWWIKRIVHATLLFDIIRLDHFRGFESAWKVPTLKACLLSFMENKIEDKHNFLNQVEAFFSEQERKNILKIIKATDSDDLKSKLDDILKFCSNYWHREENLKKVESYLNDNKEDILLFIKTNKPQADDVLSDEIFLKVFAENFLNPLINTLSYEQQQYIESERKISAAKYILRKTLIQKIIALFDEPRELSLLTQLFLDYLPDRYNMAYQIISRFLNAECSINLTPLYGEWGKGLQDGLLQRVLQALYADFKFVIAEDLGIITDDVRKLKDRVGVMGMKVFLFDDYPKDYEPLYYATTGTHDTQTLIAWWRELAVSKRQKVLDILFGQDVKNAKNYSQLKLNLLDAILQSLWDSKARTIVIPFQDLYHLEGRINIPGTSGEHNWSYRMPETVETFLTAERTLKIADLIDNSLRKKWNLDKKIQILETLPFNISSGKVQQVRSFGEHFDVAVAILNSENKEIVVELWTNLNNADDNWYALEMEKITVLANNIEVYQIIIPATLNHGDHFEFTVRCKSAETDYCYATAKIGKNGHLVVRK